MSGAGLRPEGGRTGRLLNELRADAVTVLSDDLKVMDASAIALCRDNNIPIVVFNIREQGNLARVLAGEGVATIVSNQGE